MDLDIHRQLISHVIDSGSLREAMDAGVRREWFLEPKSLDGWDYILEYYGTYAQVPSQRAFKAEYPNYELDRELEPLDYILAEAKNRREMAILDTALYNAAHASRDGDAATVRRILLAAVADVEAEMPSVKAVDITKTGTARIERYRELRDKDNHLKGITTGFLALDDATGGWRDGQLVVFAGRPKSGKSTFLLLSAIKAWLSGKKVLFVGFEMSREEQEERLDAIQAMVSQNQLRDGSLPQLEMKKVEKAIRGMELLPAFWFANSETSSPAAILSLAQTLKPDMVVIDGAYMMEDDKGEDPNSNKALLHICQALKFGAMKLAIPFLISTQMLPGKMHGEEITYASIGYSTAFSMYADAVIGVQVTDDPLISMVRLLLCRSGSPVDFWYYRDWNKAVFKELDENPFGDDDDDDDEDRGAWHDRHNF